jgi:hypothetical protein
MMVRITKKSVWFLVKVFENFAWFGLGILIYRLLL